MGLALLDPLELPFIVASLARDAMSEQRRSPFASDTPCLLLSPEHACQAIPKFLKRSSGLRQPAQVRSLLGIGFEVVQLFETVAGANVVQSSGNERFIGPLAAGSCPPLASKRGLPVSMSRVSSAGPSLPCCGAENRSSDRPGNGEVPPRPSRSTTVAGMLRRLTGCETTRPAGAAPRIDDHQGNLNDLPVQATTVEKQHVITQMLAMVRGHDDQCVVEQAATFQLMKQNLQPPIEIRDGVVIVINRHLHKTMRERRFVARHPVVQGHPVPR